MKPELPTKRHVGRQRKIAIETYTEIVTQSAHLSGRELATRYGVAPATISRILAPRRISHVQGQRMLNYLKALYTEFGDEEAGRLIHQIDPAWPNPHGTW